MVATLAVDKSVFDICCLGDKLINLQCAQIFKANKKLEKGVAFPTSLSVNNTVAHFSPLSADEEVVILKEVCVY